MKLYLTGVRLWVLFFLASMLPLISAASSSIIDLSYTYNKNTPSNPRFSSFELRVAKRGFNKNGTWIEMNDLFSSEHAGTHLDAPAHFSKGGITVDQIQLRNIYRVPGAMIDVRNQSQRMANYEIKPRDIQDWIDSHGPLPDGGVVIFQTGWGRKAFNLSSYSGMDQFGRLNFPGLGKEAAEFLVNYANKTQLSEGILGVGIDTLSLDVGTSVDYPAHTTILSAGLYGLENIANVHMVPAKGFTLTVLPMKIGLGSGGPARVVAEVGGVSFAAALSGATVGLECHAGTVWTAAVAALVGGLFPRRHAFN